MIYSSSALAALLFTSINFQRCGNASGANDEGRLPSSNSSKTTNDAFSSEFNSYWYAGKAELSSFKLQQARYGEIHDGTAMLVFVTEDFSRSKQVKLDNPESAGNDKLPVLKMNLVKKFNTGIYPYSMMLSAISPVDILNNKHAVKTTASVQELCGMTFTQLNQQNEGFEVISYSYFESEGDRKEKFELCWLEDELWNLLRLNPDQLPTGPQKVLPGSLFTRLSHEPLKIQEAKLRLEKRTGKNLYFIEYPALNYLLLITFKQEFPYQIIGWEETFPGFDGKKLTTTAILDTTIMTDYWNHHFNDDRAMREALHLPADYQ